MIRQENLEQIRTDAAAALQTILDILCSLAGDVACIEAYIAGEPCPTHDDFGTEPLGIPLAP
jgi:hypothetical protein